jgi:cytochrome c peroxidase
MRRAESKTAKTMMPRACLLIPCLGCFLASLTVFTAVSGQTSGVNGVSGLPPQAPAPTDNLPTPEKISLGKQLFFDPRLSGDDRMSCATCHVPEKAFTDGFKTAKGAAGRSLKRNTQSLLNVGLYSVYFWDGRAGSLEQQALVPIAAADEMNQDLNELVRELSAVPAYVKQFQSAFGTGVTKDGIAKALAAFERTLVTRNSPFDRFLAGDKSALSEQAREGWRLFRDAGCIRCHSGPAFSDNKFYRLGVGYRDPGRGGITGDKQQLYAFRTPSLRDVARTAPYMHDGSFETLAQVVEFYFRSTPSGSSEGLTIDFEPLAGWSFSGIAPIVAFLDSLTGEAPEVSPPRLP